MAADMDVDTFMRRGFDSLDSDDDVPPQTKASATKKKGKTRKSQGQKRREKLKSQGMLDTRAKVSSKTAAEKHGAEDGEENATKKNSGVSKHKAVIGSLAANDPEFYKFLQEEDKNLLNFDDSSDEEEVHKLPSNLVEQQEKAKKKRKLEDSDSDMTSSESDSSDRQVAAGDSSDGMDDSDSEQVSAGAPAKLPDSRGRALTLHVTKSMVDRWCTQLEKRPRIEVADSLIKALQGAVSEAAGGSQDVATAYRVEGVTTFNAVIRSCLKNFPQTFAALLNYSPKMMDLPSRCKRWGEVKVSVRLYLSALLQLLKNLAAADVINAVLKHVSQLTSYIVCLPKQTRLYMKTLIGIWAKGEETSRVLSFLCILRLIRLKQSDLLEKTLKTMYMTYVRNCKFSSPTLLPMISFMQHSLVEIFGLDRLLGYQYTFVYVRQLAIHLRNAIASKKKEAHQAVYNWQFIHSCSLFSRLVSTLYSDENIRQLVFPLIQIITGVIRLIPTARFYPLRFQCIRMLNLISLETGVYIPTLSYILEVIEITDFQKKMSRVNTRRIDFSCILKLSKTQTHDRAFKDGVMDQLYELALDHLSAYSHTISFPEVVSQPLHQMKQFVKTCKVANFTKLFKQIISKVDETTRVIQCRRRGCAINLSSPYSVRDWETASRLEGTPLTTYYKQYRVLRDREVQMEISGKEQMESYDKTPIIPTGQRRATESERKEFSSLFDGSQSEDSSDDDEERFKPKSERKQKARVAADDSSDDDVSSLNSEEYAILDRDVSDEERAESDEEGAESDEEGAESDEEGAESDEERAESDEEGAESDEEGAESGEEGAESGESDMDMVTTEDVVEDLELSDLDDC